MWFTKSLSETVEGFNADLSNGLTAVEAKRRLSEYGPNKLAEKKKKSLLVLFLEQLNDTLIYILLAAAAISAALGEISDAVIILVVVLINAVVGVVQESKAEKALDALKKLSSPHALVRRDGAVVEIPSEDIVPGDIVVIDAGRVIPCDLRWAEAVNLKVEEAALTGESVPVEKDASYIAKDGNAPLGDRVNMGYLSTTATYGRGIGIAVGTGMNTEIGKIAGMLEANEEESTPLQKKLDEFGKKLGTAILILCGVMFVVEMGSSWLKLGHLPAGKDLIEFFLEAVSLAVAAIPEGLAAIVTIVLAIGMQRMVQRNAIVRKLPAVETLGAVNVICSDKTGTLTQNKMTVLRASVNGETGSVAPKAAAAASSQAAPAGAAQTTETGTAPAELRLEPLDNEAHRLLLEDLVLCNDATVTEKGSTGDPTEVALVELGARYGVIKEQVEADHPRIGELPFDSDRKLMTTVHSYEDCSMALTKGATDELIKRCSSILLNGREVALDSTRREEVLRAADGMSRDALRVLGAAYRRFEKGPVETSELEKDLVFVGLVGMIDPPRLEVKDSIALCAQSGITTVMITGDHKSTALAIARELGIAREENQALSGSELDSMSDRELEDAVGHVRVFARVSPEHKVRIVKAFRAKGNIVSMTGDGVNDAPSLKAADIGVAMGITGTDVAKGAADMVLTDDNFKTIVSAIGEGRNIYANIRKAILFLLSCNAGEIIAIFGAICVGWVPPLLPIHILWVNLITDVLPALALGMDPGDPDVMKAKPRNPDESLFANGGAKFTILNGLLIGAITLAAYQIGEALHPLADPGAVNAHAQTMAFIVLSVSELVHAFNLRNKDKSIFQIGVFSNLYLIGALIVGIILQNAVILIPGIAKVFKVTALTLEDWGIVTLFALVPLTVNEIAKLIRRIGTHRPAVNKG